MFTTFPFIPNLTYERLGLKTGDFPEAERVLPERLRFPSNSLRDEEQDYIVERLQEIIR